MKKLRIILLFIFVSLIPVFSITLFAESGNMTIQGNVPSSLSLSVPSSVSLPTLVPGTSVESGAHSVTVSTNTTNWTLTVAETGGEIDGKMATSNYNTLTYPIQIKGGDLTNYQSLGSSTITLKSAGNGSATINDIYFRQPVAPNERIGSYSITLVFTATPVN